MATHSRRFAWKILWQRSVVSCSPYGCRVGHDWANKHNRSTEWPFWDFLQCVFHCEDHELIFPASMDSHKYSKSYKSPNSLTLFGKRKPWGWNLDSQDKFLKIYSSPKHLFISTIYFHPFSCPTCLSFNTG